MLKDLLSPGRKDLIEQRQGYAAMDEAKDPLDLWRERSATHSTGDVTINLLFTSDHCLKKRGKAEVGDMTLDCPNALESCNLNLDCPNALESWNLTLDCPNALEPLNLSLDRPNALESMYGRCDAAATIKDLDRPNVLESRYGSWNKAVTKTAKSELNGELEQRACDREGRHTIQDAGVALEAWIKTRLSNRRSRGCVGGCQEPRFVDTSTVPDGVVAVRGDVCDRVHSRRG